MPIFKIRIYKNWGGGASSDEWSNSYDIFTPAPAGIDSENVTNALIDFTAAERNSHLTAVVLSRAVVTYLDGAPDGAEKPEPRVYPIGLAGLVDDVPPVGAPRHSLPLDMVLKISHSSGSSRPGTNSYRGSLGTQHWRMNGDKPELVGDIRQNYEQVYQPCIDDPSYAWVKQRVNKDGTLGTSSDVTRVTVKGIFARDRHNAKRQPGDLPTTEKQALADLERLALEATALVAGFAVLKGAGKLITTTPVLQQAAGAMGTAAGGVLGILRP